MNQFTFALLITLTFSCTNIDINEEYTVGIESYENGKYEIAIEKLTHVISTTDTCNNCLLYRGYAYRNLSEYKKAKTDFTALLTSPIIENKCNGYVNRGSIYYDEVKYRDAISNYKEALKFCVDSGSVMNMISHMYFAINKKDSGCIYYQKSIQLQESDWNPEIPKYCKKR